MKKKFLKNNLGNATLIVVISVIILAIVGTGVYFYLDYTKTQKIVTQYNEYAEKRKAVFKSLSDIGEEDTSKLTPKQLKNKTSELLVKWDEVEKMEIPDIVKKEVKDCHESIRSNLEAFDRLFEIADQNPNLNQLSQAQIREFQTLSNSIDTDKSIEICKDASDRYWKELNKIGIEKVEE